MTCVEKSSDGAWRCGSQLTGCLKNGSHVRKDFVFEFKRVWGQTQTHTHTHAWRVFKRSDSLCADGGREHQWPGLIWFGLVASQPGGGRRGGSLNALCKPSGHTSVLPITPSVIELHTPGRRSAGGFAKTNTCTAAARAHRSGGVGPRVDMNTLRRSISIGRITLKLSSPLLR